jgi:hypothetical protein
MPALQRVLGQCGEVVAGFWLSILGILIIVSFPITGLVASFAVGALICELIGRGTLGVVLLFITAFFVGLFLSIYVWEPHVKPTVLKVADLISGMRP